MAPSTFLRNSLFVCISLLTACIAGAPEGGGGGGTTDAGNTGTDSGDVTPIQKTFTQWLKCMQLSDFTTSNMTGAWNNIIAQGNTTCANCHVSGAHGFITTPNEQLFFDVVRSDRNYALQFFTTSLPGVPFTVNANNLAMTGVSTGQDPHREHPRFNPTLGLHSSQDLAQKTQARFDAAGGNCGP